MITESTVKMFKIESLKKFQNNNCIISRVEATDTIYKYGDVIKVVEFISKQFQQIGVSQPQGIAVQFPITGYTAGFISLLISILDYGCYFCPLNEDINSPNDISNFLNDCGTKYIISNDKIFYQKISYETKAQIKIFDETFFIFRVETQFDESNLPKNMCYAIGTSGSTGKPKIVFVPYDCIAPNIHALCSRFETTENDVIYLGTPITFDPAVVELFMAISCGSALLITNSKQRLAPQQLIRLLWPTECNKSAVTIMQTTPSLFRQFGVDAIKDIILAENARIRILILGGEEFPKPTELQEWLPRNGDLKMKIFNIYGVTEISCWSTIHELTLSDVVVKKRMPIGKPIDDVLLRINEATGELLLGSTTRKTYIPEEDGNFSLSMHKKSIDDAVLYRKTGDLVERDQNGEIYYIGRLNNTIKRMGKRICLDALEKRIETFFSSTEMEKVVCLLNPHNQQLICYLKYQKEIKDIKRIIMKNLSNYEKPDIIEQRTEAFPLNRHGKLDRKMLLENINKARTSQPLNIFTRFLKETLIPEIEEPNSKRQKLDENLSGLKKSFSALGGTSFHALSLATEIGQYLSNGTDQRQLLEKLLDPNHAVLHILEFLKMAPICKKKQLNLDEQLTMPTTQRLKFLWRVDLEKCIDAKPAINITNRYISIGSHANLLFIVDAFSGKEISRLKLRSRIECEAVFVNSNLALIGCNAGYLYGFNYLNGVILWSIYIGEKVKAKPLVFDTYALVGCYDDNFNLSYICLENQAIKWRKKIGSKPIFSSPLRLGNMAVLVCALDGTYECLEIQTGNTLWSKKCATPIFSTPSILESSETFALAEVSGKVHICNIENGEILHSFSADGNIFSNLTTHRVNNTTVQIVFGCHDHNVYCLNYARIRNENQNESSLSLCWKKNVFSAVYATPIIVHLIGADYVFACSTKGLLSVLTLNTGVIESTHKLEGEIFSTPCFFKNEENEMRVCFGCRDNFLYCFQIC